MGNHDTDSATFETGGHLFRTVSAHRTSQGRIEYKKCLCGRWRIESYPAPQRVQLEAAIDRSTVPTDRMRDGDRFAAVPVYH